MSVTAVTDPLARISNPQVARLPRHLRRFAVDQLYDQYTSTDHAVWRYIMRQNIRFLKEHAHHVYFHGLINTGISFDRIPSIQEMNDILGRIGWGAVAVDGFIPPAAFMEFQAYRVLVIACDMRQMNHIEYTPAPDIVHEAAGHAPIIVDSEYADYLQRFGEIGARAMYSKADFALYEAIRHLSILKECPDTDPAEIRAAEKEVEYRQNNLGKPSEMARLSRLHWWTVEYGLIGTLQQPKIYGAGLLSSIGESVNCLKPGVRKIRYTLDAADYSFDITTMQPQLFVTPDFAALMDVLEQFASAMAFRAGGMEGLQKAVECENVCTAEFGSGLQVSGVVGEVLTNGGGRPAYLRFAGPCALAYGGKQLPGHGKNYHADGFGSPVGPLTGADTPLERMDSVQLAAYGIREGEVCRLTFATGVEVKGTLRQIESRDGKIVLMSFDNCKVKRGGDVLFAPEWGTYDMAVGENVTSVFNGAADKDAYEQIALVPRERTIKVAPNDRTRRLNDLYRQVRDIRTAASGYEDLHGIWQAVSTEFPDDWLLGVEIVELLQTRSLYPDLEKEIRLALSRVVNRRRDFEHLVEQGYNLIDFFRTNKLLSTN